MVAQHSQRLRVQDELDAGAARNRQAAKLAWGILDEAITSTFVAMLDNIVHSNNDCGSRRGRRCLRAGGTQQELGASTSSVRHHPAAVFFLLSPPWPASPTIAGHGLFLFPIMCVWMPPGVDKTSGHGWNWVRRFPPFQKAAPPSLAGSCTQTNVVFRYVQELRSTLELYVLLTQLAPRNSDIPAVVVSHWLASELPMEQFRPSAQGSATRVCPTRTYQLMVQASSFHSSTSTEYVVPATRQAMTIWASCRRHSRRHPGLAGYSSQFVHPSLTIPFVSGIALPGC
ncbi:hypothetical protein EDB81DRAFT_328024 [Dactylonectria macrodidyma]|uniref:Uncharacterized protein n=1 Tax=Dactylonectria macrodidyma TaxID=307937 RepID=A0A9P9JJ50_9HYPO|nr:hypothetical protein EDB81DRAFT_328024 [Dactylonectria macrodidyma]